jgi:hypothetical protein
MVLIGGLFVDDGFIFRVGIWTALQRTNSCFILPGRFDFDLVRRGDELSAQAEGLSLKDAIDEIKSLLGLLLIGPLGDLTGVELQRQPVNRDGFHWFPF